MTDELPEGWASALLRELTKVEWGDTSITKKSYVPKGFVAFSASGPDGLLPSFEWQGPAVVLSAIGARCGKCFIADGKWTAIKNTIVIQGNPDYVDHRFLFHYLNDERKWNISGSGQPFITMGSASELVVPVAPIAEQSRIVKRLEKLLAEVEQCKERMAKIPLLLKRFRQSVLAAACSGRLTADWREEQNDTIASTSENGNEKIVEVPEGWNWHPLVELCDPDRAICYGVIKLGPEVDGGVPCLRTSDVKPLRIDSSNVKSIADAISDEYRRTVLRGGEVLVNVRGTLGGVSVVPESMRDWNISREVAMVPIQKASAEYIAFWIASLPTQNWLTSVVKGVAYSGINIEDLRELPVALPPSEEQQEIIQRVKKLLALADRIESRYEVAKKQVESLTQSILAKAFRGELVPTETELAAREGRDYETAAQLLDRIRALAAESISEKGNGQRRTNRRIR